MLLAPAPVDAIDGGDALRLAFAGGVSFFVVLAVVPTMRRVALAKGLTDSPRHDRWHDQPTPYLGGAAVVAGVLAALVFLPRWNTAATVIMLGAVVVAVLGLVDDFRNVSAVTRLLLEVAVATAAFVAGARIELFDNGLDFVITVGWIVIVTNGFNLLDNMDGGMASIAAVVSAAIATIALVEGDVVVAGVAVATGTACAGFLIFNWYPAQIFLGDAGSLFVGFILAATALELRPSGKPSTLTGLVLLLSPALFDTVLVIISRVRAGRSVFVGGTDHTSHRLMRIGLGQRQTAATLAAASAILVATGALVAERRISAVVATTIVGIGLVGSAAGLLRVRVYATRQAARLDGG